MKRNTIKQLFIILAFMLLANVGFAQVLDGVYVFRLGMTEEELREKIDTTEIESIKLEPIMSNSVAYKNRIKVININRFYPHYPQGISPQIDSLEIAKIEQYVLKSITLKFLDNKIYEISFSDKYNSLEELLTQKYGKPKKKGKLKTKTETEYKPYGERTSRYDDVKSKHTIIVRDDRTKEWDTGNKDINCTLFYGNNYMRYFIINDAIDLEISLTVASELFRGENEVEKKIKEDAYDAL